MMVLRILGIDPGLRHAAWAMIEGSQKDWAIIAYGSIDPPTQDPLCKRLHLLYSSMVQVLITHTPHAISLEETLVNSNAKSSLLLGMARGAILTALGTSSTIVSMYSPTHVKKRITGHGNSSKNHVSQAVMQWLTPDNIVSKLFLSFDITDALALALCHGLFLWEKNLELIK
jgi:crossover junction endodeoxyribonuclease RuvC